MPWRPGQRDARRALEAPYEDIPEHLMHPLWGWVEEHFDTGEVVFFTGIQMRVGIPDARASNFTHQQAVQELRERCYADEGFLLDLIELYLRAFGWGQGSAEKLETILSMGNSVYRVRDDYRGLELRVVPEVKEEVQAVVDAAVGSPGAHLAVAWTEAYGRTHDPVKAYSEAIKAVESAAAPVISPKNLKATLGTLIKDIENKPTKWTFVIESPNVDSVDAVKNLMSLLWSGQTSRHGGINPTTPETVEAARAAVHIAATLVQVFVSKAFSEA